MISTLLSTLFGGVFGIITPIIKNWDERKNASSEANQTQMQFEIEQKRMKMQLKMMEQLESLSDKNIEMHRTIMSQNLEPKAGEGDDVQKSSLTQICDFINGLMRPLITATFIGLYVWTVYNILSVIMATKNYDDLLDNGIIISFIDIISGMLAFWFGNRVLTKGR